MLRPSSGNKTATITNPADAGAEAASDPALAPAGVKRERNAAVTRQRILDAGEREFAARGFAGARLREIAESAGVQPALIHHYFTDKHGLYRAVLDRAIQPSSTESWTLLSSGLDLEGLMSGFIEVLLRFYAKHHNLLAILRHEALSGSTVLEELTRERTLPIVEAITALLAEKQRAGELRADIPPAEIIAAGMGLVAFPFVEAGLIRVMLPSLEARDEAALLQRKESIVKMLLAAVRPDAEPKREPVKKAPAKKTRGK
ncbi:MAG: TetR/AcrR family transcriptional regulator [Minicystis sp.]